NIYEWITKYEYTVHYNGWDEHDMTSGLVAGLEKGLLQWCLATLQAQPGISWVLIKQQLLSHYGHGTEATSYHQVLKNLSFSATSSLECFLDLVRTYFKKVEPHYSFDSLFEIFLEKIPP